MPATERDRESMRESMSERERGVWGGGGADLPILQQRLIGHLLDPLSADA